MKHEVRIAGSLLAGTDSDDVAQGWNDGLDYAVRVLTTQAVTAQTQAAKRALGEAIKLLAAANIPTAPSAPRR